jgi:valyl-tRNA synthetase
MAQRAGEEMPKAYEPTKTEARWYQFWLEKGYFRPQIDQKKKPFVIIMPPPSVTGELHLGHALTATLEDIMVRWHRMCGQPTMWLPGVDHAGIATQVVVEQLLDKEGTNRHVLGREKFVERVWQWVNQYRSRISIQHQKLGVSCDWERECFTLNEGPSKAVRTTFVRLFEKGLIYRGERIINWCSRCATALSELEVDHKDLTGNLYYIRYPLENGGKEYITVATTRPETILGDTAVAVNPDDRRFKNIAGRKAILPVISRVIPIVADTAVDSAFGTGAVKITPAHDPVDFEVAERHGLPLINILNSDATMNREAGPYKGLDRTTCRKKILEDLDKQGLLVKVEPYSHSVGHCHRCDTVIEPLASKQWFVKVAPLAAPAIGAVSDGRIKILPQRFTRVYLNWMENIRDWCISRQLWWGHRIPVWYCTDCDELIVSLTDPDSCTRCASIKIEQDPDVLDTWFSSALWPHSTLGWPGETEDLAYFYPTSVMETAYDILFFWVARMIMMGLENTGQIPFETVYLHGLIRDEKGEKMSKTKGNVLDPLTIIEQYGTDALRFALLSGTSPGNDTKLSQTKLEAGRNFANKLWNAARFILGHTRDGGNVEIKRDKLLLEDRWILSRLSCTIANVNRLLADFQFGEAERHLHNFLWGEFCDWYIELAKVRLRIEDNSSPLPILLYVLEVSLRLLHPFMPFVTEELWQNIAPQLGVKAQSIMVDTYPEASEADIDSEAERVMTSVLDIIRAIRNARAQHRVAAAQWINAQVYAGELKTVILPYAKAIQALSRAKPVTFPNERSRREAVDGEITLVLDEVEVVIPLASMVDTAVEEKRIEQEMKQLKAGVERIETRLKDEQFLTKAPPQVVDRERQHLNTLKGKLERFRG